MSHVQKMNLMKDLYVQTLSRKFGMEDTCIQILAKDILDLKYATILDKHIVNGKDNNSQRKRFNFLT